MLKTRVITAICGLPVLIAAVWFEEFLPWFTMLAVVLGVMASLEFSRVINIKRAQVFAFYGAVMTLFHIIFRDVNVLSVIDTAFDIAVIPYLLLAAMFPPLLWSWLPKRTNGQKTWMNGVWTIIGILFTGWMLGHLVAMRGLEDGRNWVFMTLFVTFAYDTAAYFVGRRYGKHKMAPTVSPGKSWEGAAGGLVFAVVVSLFFTLSTPLGLPVSWGHAVIIGIIASIAGQTGDLLESKFKRYAGVKDSGAAIPGHGGFLDRMDSVFVNSIVVYYYIVWVIL